MKLGKMKARVQGEKLVIEIPLRLLKFAIENNPDFRFQVKDLKKMGKYYASAVLEGPGVTDTGVTPFEQHLDSISIDAYESGEDWIENKDDEEDY